MVGFPGLTVHVQTSRHGPLFARLAIAVLFGSIPPNLSPFAWLSVGDSFLDPKKGSSDGTFRLRKSKYYPPNLSPPARLSVPDSAINPKQFRQNISTEKIQAAKGLLAELKRQQSSSVERSVAAMLPGPVATAKDLPALVSALERLVEAYIALAMVRMTFLL